VSNASLSAAGVIFAVVFTVELGGLSLIAYLTRKQAGYLDNPVRRALFTAGHAHAGVLVILALVALLYVDQADLSDTLKWLVRTAMALAPILMSAGFFLCIALPTATKPNRLIALVYLGGLSLFVGSLTLGIGLLRAT
jgi:cytochrome bd-type quinol oxidase subunit 2